MNITLYRKHDEACITKLTKGETVNGKFVPGIFRRLSKQELKKALRNHTTCACWIWKVNPNGTRESTKLDDWQTAVALIQKQDAESKNVEVYGYTIAFCIAEYLRLRDGKISPDV